MHAKILAFTGALLVAPLSIALASPVSQIVVFGDSLSDAGNAAIAAGPLFPPNYSNGELTDGPTTRPATTGPVGLWIDQFAAKIGAADPTPYLAGGTNYAVATADTGTANLQDIGNQVAAFSLSHLGNAPSSALYTVWGGANDLFNGAASGKTAADNLFGYILTLSGEGAKNFLWLNLANLGETPRGFAQGASALSTASAEFNAEWALDLAALKGDGINVIGVDVNTLFNQILANPFAYGFTNVTNPAQGTTGNPNDSLFWDIEHPTTTGDALIANAAYDAYAAPEPLSAGLSLLGFVALLTALKLRRKHLEI